LLAEKADGVVVGNIVGGTINGTTALLTVDVELTIKGVVKPHAVITVVGTLNMPQSAVYKERGLFFLGGSPATPSEWTALPLQTGSMMGLRSLYFNLSQTTRPKRTATALNTPVEQALAWVLGSFEEGRTGPGSPVNLLLEYKAIQHPSAATRLLFAGFTSQNVHLKKLPMWIGLLDGDESAIAELYRQSSTMSEVDFKFATQQLRDMKKVTPATKRLLGNIVTSSAAPVDLRSVAAALLVRIHDAESVQVLAPLLYGSDIQLAATAVCGLSLFANNVRPNEFQPPRPEGWKYFSEDTIRYSAGNPEQLQRDPSILSFWKRWWEQYRVDIQRQAPELAVP
jgi:hypothetical protein